MSSKVDKRAHSALSAKRIDAIEERLAQMEALMQSIATGTAQLSAANGPEITAIASDGNIPLTRHSSSFPPSVGPVNDVNSSSGGSQTTVRSSTGQQCEGSFAASTMLCDHRRPTGNSSGAEPQMQNRHPKRWDLAISGRSPEGVTSLRLPPLNEARLLVEDYLDSFNRVVPLFDPTTLTQLMSKNYTRDLQDDSPWWAAMNIVFALAYRMRAMSMPDDPKQDQLAWGHLQNALGVASELSLTRTSLLGLQALLGMAVVLQGTPNPYPASMLVAAAVRLCHNLGMHKREGYASADPSDVTQRIRVFWIAYVLDKDFSLRLDQPPLLTDDEVVVDLPSNQLSDDLGLLYAYGGTCVIDIFRLRCQLAIIQGKIYSKLYSARALKLPWQERTNAVTALSRLLESWKCSIPTELRPDRLTSNLKGSDLVHIMILFLTYFNCLCLVHRCIFNSTGWMEHVRKANGGSLEPCMGKESQEFCFSAARASIRLVRLGPQGNFACIWVLLYYWVSALVILLKNVIENPYHALAKADLQLVTSLLELLDILADDAETEDVYQIREICNELFQKAVFSFEDSHVNHRLDVKRKRSPDDLGNQISTLDRVFFRGAQPPSKESVDSTGHVGSNIGKDMTSLFEFASETSIIPTDSQGWKLGEHDMSVPNIPMLYNSDQGSLEDHVSLLDGYD
ncbi:hypothetical protein MMC25_008168 [Agyrium rufum]|nr:hypothetical protein [Agyrium rufum]